MTLSVRNDELSNILEDVQFGEFRESEPHIEGLFDGECALPQLETNQSIVENPDTLTFWFAELLFTLCSVGQESAVIVHGLILTAFPIDRVIHQFA